MPEPQKPQGPLDELMLAMDVVDTLRHRQHLVERELNADDRDKQLIERLREIYRSQGIDVPDRVLLEGLAALKEERFTYHPPAPGLSVTLARWYVNRDKWLKPLLVALSAIVAAGLLYYVLVRAPARRFLASLPGQLSAQREAIVAGSQVPAASEQAVLLATEGEEALGQGDASAAQKKLAELKALRADLEREYELRVVMQPNQRSGIIRTPDLNPEAKNYYIIVEAVAPDGSVLTMPVTNEEDGKTTSVSAWGLRVEKELFDQIAADKQDDGIIQNRVFGAKRRGYLSPEYRMSTSGAALTTW